MEGNDEVEALSLPQGWSQLPPEILGIIFSNLQRKSDLLSSRFVCRSWNAECVRAMKKPESEFLQTLTESNINQYIDFLHNSGGLCQVNNLPFHLNVNLNIVNSKETGTECYETKLNKLTLTVKSLCDNFGKECIAKFTLNTPTIRIDSDDTRYWLLEFLVMISPGLKILDLSDFDVRLGYYTEDEIKSTELCDLKFPNLTTLTCSKWKFPPDDEEYELFRRNGSETNYSIYPYIIDRSPNMEILEGVSAQELISLSVNYDKLKTVLIDDWTEDPLELLVKFRQSNSPKLQKFAFSLEDYTPDDAYVIFEYILDFVSSTLKSLTITTMEMEMEISQPLGNYSKSIGTRTGPLMPFPNLPHLQHLRINVNMASKTDDLIFYDPEEIDFNPENLPSLKYVDLPLGFILCGQSERDTSLKEEFQVPVNFSTVNKLTIRIDHTRWSNWMTGIGVYKGEGALRHLQKVFPNVSKLSIVNESNKSEQQQGVKHLFQYLIRSPLSKNINQISIEGFKTDFLGQVLQQMDTVSEGQGQSVGFDSQVVRVPVVSNNTFFLKNVRKVILGLSPLTRDKCRIDDPFSHSYLSVPNLTDMAKYFPSLQIIEISKLLFRGMTETEQKELIQTLATGFPYLQIQRY